MADRPQLDRIEQYVRQGEGEHLEFKQQFSSEAVIARSLIAFANGDGGILLIGVDEAGNAVGLTDNEVARTLERLRGLARSLIPAAIPVGTVEIQGRKVVYASVNPVPEHLKPLTTAEGEIYRRESNRDVRFKSQPLPAVVGGRSAPLRVFVAMSFREEEEPALADYFRAMLRAAQLASPSDLHLVRIDNVEGDYEISTRIMEEIDRCDVLLADFTLSPHNVYFEVGYARGKQKRIVQTARRDTVLEFDIRNWRTLLYRNATELEAHLLPAFQALLSD